MAQDTVFIRTFSVVVGGLVIFAILLIVFATMFQEQLPQEVSEARLEAVEERIEPIGAVYAGEEGKQALAAATQPQETAGSGGGEAAEPMSGEQVYNNVCAACHDAGIAGAPKLDAAFQERISKGKETLVNHAINGFQGDAGVMPAKGGNPSLSDEEVTRAVEYMIAQAKGG